MRVLVGVDLRALGHEWLIDRSGDYAARLGAAVDLVYFLGEGSEAPEHRRRLEELLARLPAERRGRARIETTEAAEGFVALSTEYDLMIVGSREPPALERLLKGPMATRVLRHARCAVAVPRGERAPGEAPRILVGVDVGGVDPAGVLRLADLWAERLGGTIHAVFAEAGHLPKIGDKAVRDAAERQWLALREPKVEALRALLATHVHPNRTGEVLVRRGEPEDVLVTLSTDYDLVLVGNRERGGLAGLVLGAVAGQVVRRAACDVISLPTATAGAEG